jgi:dihydroneopterin aldolase
MERLRIVGEIMSSIYIKDLIIEAKHGVHQHEKQLPQRFSVSVELTIDIKKASMSDELNDTLNWSQLRQIIITTVQNNTFNLIERLAKEVADQILLNKQVQSVLISIDKLDAFPSGNPGIRLTVDQENN